MRYVLFVFIIHALYPAPSAFGAGDLSSKTPYGLTNTEKAIVDNKKNIKKITIKSNLQKNSIKSIQNDLLTIKSLISSDISSSNKIKNNLYNRLSILENKISNLEGRATSLEELTNRVNLANQALKVSFLGLKDIIININNKFVSQEDLNEVKKLIPKPTISNHKLSKLAHRAYTKKEYYKAHNLYTTLVKNKYRPANSTFYLGEISYRQKKYRNAINFYTKSVNLYAKASYMSILLYHTAMSYVYLGEKKKAKPFFNSVISNFPKSKASKWSKQEIKKRYRSK